MLVRSDRVTGPELKVLPSFLIESKLVNELRLRINKTKSLAKVEDYAIAMYE